MAVLQNIATPHVNLFRFTDCTVTSTCWRRHVGIRELAAAVLPMELRSDLWLRTLTAYEPSSGSTNQGLQANNSGDSRLNLCGHQVAELSLVRCSRSKSFPILIVAPSQGCCTRGLSSTRGPL